MWDARNITTSEVVRLLSVGLRPGSRLADEDFIYRVCASVDKIRAVALWVDHFFDEAFKKEPPPDGATLSIFAPGSAARLEFWAQPDPPAENLVHARGGNAEKETRSDLDLLCIVDGWPARDARRTRLMKDFSYYLQYSKDKPRIPGVPSNFSSVWLDRMSKLPHGRFRDKECLVGRDIMKLRKEDKRFEMWRYWVVFESALLYSYPKFGRGAEELEETLARSFFGIDFEMRDKRFPLIWYHAACRYMSEIYLSALREIAETANPKKMMSKALKLKGVRVLNWSLAVVNAIVVYQLAFQGLPLDAGKWRSAKSAGLIPSLKLQEDLKQEILKYGHKGSTEEEIAESLRIRQAIDELEPLRDRLLDAYEKLFKWQEEGSPIPDSVTPAQVWEFLQGKPNESIPLTGEVVDLVLAASERFRRFREEAARTTRFAPDFLFY